MNPAPHQAPPPPCGAGFMPASDGSFRASASGPPPPAGMNPAPHQAPPPPCGAGFMSASDGSFPASASGPPPPAGMSPAPHRFTAAVALLVILPRRRQVAAAVEGFQPVRAEHHQRGDHHAVDEGLGKR